MRTVRKKKRESGPTGIIEKSMRDKHDRRPHAYSEEVVCLIRAHIESFPLVESYYCRESSIKLFIADSEMSVSKILRLLNNILKSRGVNLEISDQKYRFIFYTEYNISFHSPLKDKCGICESWNNCPEQDKSAYAEEYNLYLKNKTNAKQLLRDAITLAKIDDSIRVIDYDLQKALPTPKDSIGPMYYLCKLNIWDFTIYNFIDKQGYCHLWNETVGNKGSNEIASFLYLIYEKLVEMGTSQIFTFSDDCGGQNKCQKVFVMNLLAAVKLKIKITQR